MLLFFIFSFLITKSFCEDDNKQGEIKGCRDCLASPCGENSNVGCGCDEIMDSIHSNQIQTVYNIPVDVLIRPIPPVLDEEKVKSLMETIEVNQLQLSNPPPLPIDYKYNGDFQYAYVTSILSLCNTVL